jgi:hypothetical protein
MGGNGKPISQNGLVRRLAPFGSDLKRSEVGTRRRGVIYWPRTSWPSGNARVATRAWTA